MLHGIESFVDRLENNSVVWYTDNKAVTSIVRKGSMVDELQSIAEQISIICRNKQISLSVQWIPRRENSDADAASRMIDTDSWKVHPSLFCLLDSNWGSFTIDRFASEQNAQLPRFNSRFAAPSSLAIDAFTQNWAGENNWVVPPPKLVPRVVRYIVCCKAKAC